MMRVEAFSGLPETRKGPAIRYSVTEILTLAVSAILCGANNWMEVADWCKDRRGWLGDYTDFRYSRGTPSHDTFGNVFQSRQDRPLRAELLHPTKIRPDRLTKGRRRQKKPAPSSHPS